VVKFVEKRTEMTPEVIYRYRWPGEGLPAECDNFFLGIWHPHKIVHVEWPPALSTTTVRLQGSNWFLASACSPLHKAGTGLVHQFADSSCAVAFRGYILTSLIHSYSPSQDILEYWQTNLFAEHNGVFSAAIVGRRGENLTLISDILGMGPLYYRKVGEAVAFATNPRYLVIADDEPDLVAWSWLLHTGFISTDRSLSQAIRRLPAGKALCCVGDTHRMVSCFDFARLPHGARPVGKNAVSEVEDAFQQAITRCLRLGNENIILPLSSGHDSRRILASMLQRNIDFQAYTCRVLQKQHRDLDARFAAEMARDFAFPLTISEPGTPDQYATDDYVRRLLVDAETDQHTWVLSLMRSLPRHPSLFFDGVAGDILGSPVGWSVVFNLAHMSRSAEDEIEAIANQCIIGRFSSLLRSDYWPELEEVRDDVKIYLKTFLPRNNIDDLAFLLLRQRRSTALWSQQLLPSGHVVVCPYLDLDYIRLLLDFNPAGKRAIVFQRRCLQDFWPQFSKYPGNRDIPEDLPPGSPQFLCERILTCQKRLREEIEIHGGMPLLYACLTSKGKLALMCSKRSRALALRASWFLNPLMELVSRQVRASGCWRQIPQNPPALGAR